MALSSKASLREEFLEARIEDTLRQRGIELFLSKESLGKVRLGSDGLDDKASRFPQVRIPQERQGNYVLAEDTSGKDASSQGASSGEVAPTSTMSLRTRRRGCLLAFAYDSSY